MGNAWPRLNAEAVEIWAQFVSGRRSYFQWLLAPIASTTLGFGLDAKKMQELLRRQSYSLTFRLRQKASRILSKQVALSDETIGSLSDRRHVRLL